MDLASLFEESIETQDDLGGHASDVWLIKTANEEVVVWASGVTENSDAPFLYGCRELFGNELSRTFELELMNQELALISRIPIPQVLRKAIIDEVEYVVVNKMEGIKRQFIDCSPSILEAFGRDLATIHSKSFNEFGNLDGTFRFPVTEFNNKLAQVIREIAQRYYKDQEEAICHEIIQELLELPNPSHASYVMLDLDSRQFLFDDDKITAMVDTEAYVIGPRELDLITLECSLNLEGASAFRRGYESVDTFPILDQLKKPYRYFYALLQVKGPIDYIEWMNTPQYFDMEPLNIQGK